MSVNIPQLANPKAVTIVLSSVTPADIYTASNGLRGIVNSISICNVTAAADVFSISLVSPAAVVFDIYRDAPIDAHETIILKHHETPIFDGWSLRVEQGAAVESLHIVAVIGEMTVVRGS